MTNEAKVAEAVYERQTTPISIREAIDGKNILLTGGTGFLGKVLIEKLLRSTDVGIIYVLIRSRKGSTPQARMQEEIVQSQIFERLKKEIGVDAFAAMAAKKLVAVDGDVTHMQVGLSAKDIEMLRVSVHHIIHCAANVDFNERLDRAVELNVMILSNCQMSHFIHFLGLWVVAPDGAGSKIHQFALVFACFDLLCQLEPQRTGCGETVSFGI